MTGKYYQRLSAWREAIDLSEEVCRMTRSLPLDLAQSMIVSLRRSSLAVAADLAEGQERGGPQEFIRYVHSALANLDLVESELMMAQRLSYADAEENARLLAMVAQVRQCLDQLLGPRQPMLAA